MSIKTILVTGGSGLVGKALRKVKNDYFMIFLDSKMCDLRNYNETLLVFKEINPYAIIHLAACVGGLYKNMSQKVKMLEDNLLINTHVIKAAHESGIQTVIACLSTCVFPELVFPESDSGLLNERLLHNGPPHPSNEGYAYAKRIMDTHCKVYRETFDRRYFCIIPTNIYGPHDNFHLEDAHVIPALIHKCYLAKKANIPFEIRGTGKPLRQFVYSIDLAHIILQLLNSTVNENIIISPENVYSIYNVAEIIYNQFEMENGFITNEEFSDGQYQKTVDTSKLKETISFEFTPLTQGIQETVEWFLKNYNFIRK
jgi:GDP-L-fucose synthase